MCEGPLFPCGCGGGAMDLGVGNKERWTPAFQNRLFDSFERAMRMRLRRCLNVRDTHLMWTKRDKVFTNKLEKSNLTIGAGSRQSRDRLVFRFID